MKILKPGKVEMRKFVCPDCGCTFVACETDAYDDYIKCPQDGCKSIVSWKDNGEPYEEPTPTQPDKKRLCELINRWRAETSSTETLHDYLIAHDVTFKEG